MYDVIRKSEVSSQPTQHTAAEVGFLLSGGGRMRLQRAPMTGADWAIAIGAALPITCIIGVFILFTVFG